MSEQGEYCVNITETAFDDLAKIALYIKVALKEPVIAKKQIARIKKGIFSLNSNPTQNPLVRDTTLALHGYRPMLVDNYTIFYTISEEKKTVNVLRVQYSRRNWAMILKGESNWYSPVQECAE